MHNIIVENERDTYAGNFAQLPSYDYVYNSILQQELGEENFAPYERYIQRHMQLRDREKHQQLRADLVEFI